MAQILEYLLLCLPPPRLSKPCLLIIQPWLTVLSLHNSLTISWRTRTYNSCQWHYNIRWRGSSRACSRCRTAWHQWRSLSSNNRWNSYPCRCGSFVSGSIAGSDSPRGSCWTARTASTSNTEKCCGKREWGQRWLECEPRISGCPPPWRAGRGTWNVCVKCLVTWNAVREMFALSSGYSFTLADALSGDMLWRYFGQSFVLGQNL